MGTIRNRIIHSSWRVCYDHQKEKTYAHLERVFTGPSLFGPTPKTEKEKRELMGKVIFDAAALKIAAEKFRNTAARIQKTHEAVTFSRVSQRRA